MRQSGEVTHELAISFRAFGAVVEAIRLLSLERARFAKFKDVVVEALEQCEQITAEDAQRFVGILPVDGDIRVYLRLSAAQNAMLDRLKARLNELANAHCSVRDALIFCVLFVAEARNLTCRNSSQEGTL